MSHYIEYALLSGVAFLFRWLPMTLSRGLGRAVGFFGGSILKIRMGVALDNIHQAFPTLPLRERKRLYRKTWRHFGMVAAELSRLPRMKLPDLSRYIESGDTKLIERIFESGKGAIFVSGHIGNWEWLGAMVAEQGFPFTFVVENQSNRLVEAWMDRMRMRKGVEIFSRRQATRGTLQALKKNRMVAMLCDQDAGNSGVFVSFFNKVASTPRGPAVFHLKTGAPLIYGSCCRKNGVFRLSLEEIVPPASPGSIDEHERAIMAVITTRLEADIKEYPDQYMWLHRRWKTPPP